MTPQEPSRGTSGRRGPFAGRGRSLSAMLVLAGATALGGCQVWDGESMRRLSTLLKIDKKLDTGVTGYHTPRQSDAHAAETEQAARSSTGS